MRKKLSAVSSQRSASEKKRELLVLKERLASFYIRGFRDAVSGRPGPKLTPEVKVGLTCYATGFALGLKLLQGAHKSAKDFAEKAVGSDSGADR